MASKPISEAYRGYTIDAHNHGYTITGGISHRVDERDQVKTNLETGEKLPVPGPACDSFTNLQRAKLYIDRTLNKEDGPLG